MIPFPHPSEPQGIFDGKTRAAQTGNWSRAAGLICWVSLGAICPPGDIGPCLETLFIAMMGRTSPLSGGYVTGRGQKCSSKSHQAQVRLPTKIWPQTSTVLGLRKPTWEGGLYHVKSGGELYLFQMY